jgi:hypothetical protein
VRFVFSVKIKTEIINNLLIDYILIGVSVGAGLVPALVSYRCTLFVITLPVIGFFDQLYSKK